MRKVLLIGGTGFIGKQMVQQLVAEKNEIILLVRSKGKAMKVFQENKHLYGNRLKFVEGDLTKKGLGFSKEDQSLVEMSDVIIHAGGPMDISVSEQEATSAFLNGAKHVSELAQTIYLTKGLEQFIHIVGYMSPFDDNNINMEIDVFKSGHQYLKIQNPYERTKFLADLYLRQQAKIVGYPISVINPPVVVGSSETGSTEQLGGLGLLVKSMRKGLMPIVPGGRDYRLPLIANDALAKCIVQILNQQQPKSCTYTLVPDKQADLNLPELLRIMAESMHVKVPTKSVPIQAMQLLLKSGGSKITGVPADGLNFMTNKDFSNDTVKIAMGQNWLQEKSVTTFLPTVIADLDYRITYPEHQLDYRFNRTRIGNIVVYQKNGEGKPFILFHGLLSDGEDLFPLGIRLYEATGQPVWIVDIPGLGRSPFVKEKNTMTAYLHIVKDVLAQADIGAHFIGHSFGAFLLVAASNANYFRPTDTITLLQPPLLKERATDLPIFMRKLMLKKASLERLEKYFLDTGLFSNVEQIPRYYSAKVKSSFSSPRILNTTVLLDDWLAKEASIEKSKVESSFFQVVWGNQDKVYQAPKKLGDITMLPYGHHFPLSHPNETAHAILKNMQI